ncbi:MAG: DUF3302 domain-containing protein [Gemmataceae bacterium]|nr:DUF3302 domain-containing protein [Gemmataceae bacterium]
MFLDYFALCLLLLMGTGLFYVFFYIHDIPYEIAEKRDHPQKDAIYWGCWLSLFTLHVLWPFIFLWAVSKPAKVTLAEAEPSDDEKSPSGKSRDGSPAAEIAQLRKQIAALQDRLAKVERQSDPAGVSHD